MDDLTATLMGMSEQRLMTWVSKATLDELREAQSVPVNSTVMAALNARIYHLEASGSEGRHFRASIAVAILILVVASITLVVVILAYRHDLGI